MVGLIVNHLFGKVVRKIEPILPLISMVAIVLIIGAVVGGTQKSIASVGLVVMLGVVLHNGIGLLGGYWGGRLLGFDEAVCRTLAIEVGMQNSGLAATLGKLYFTPIAALPGALFSVWHNLSGSLLAGILGGTSRERLHAYGWRAGVERRTRVTSSREARRACRDCFTTPTRAAARSAFNSSFCRCVHDVSASAQRAQSNAKVPSPDRAQERKPIGLIPLRMHFSTA